MSNRQLIIVTNTIPPSSALLPQKIKLMYDGLIEDIAAQCITAIELGDFHVPKGHCVFYSSSMAHRYVVQLICFPPGQAQRWHNKWIQTWYPFIVPLLCLRLFLSQDRVLLTTIFVVPKVVPLSKFTKEQRLCRSGLK